MRENTDQKKLQIRTLFTHCIFPKNSHHINFYLQYWPWKRTEKKGKQRNIRNEFSIASNLRQMFLEEGTFIKNDNYFVECLLRFWIMNYNIISKSEINSFVRFCPTFLLSRTKKKIQWKFMQRRVLSKSEGFISLSDSRLLEIILKWTRCAFKSLQCKTSKCQHMVEEQKQLLVKRNFKF